MSGPILRIFKNNTRMASAGARAYKGGLGTETPAAVQRAEPQVWAQRGFAPWSRRGFCV